MPDVPRPPVKDWATDWDHTHPDYAASAPEIWDQLRETCPVAHTERFGGAWLPTRHEDVSAIAKDPELRAKLSSNALEYLETQYWGCRAHEYLELVDKLTTGN